VRKETPSAVPRGGPIEGLGTGYALEEAVFTLPEKALSDPVRISAGYGILRVLERKPFDRVAFEKDKAALMDQLRQAKAQQAFSAYMSQVRQRFPVEVRPDVMRRVLG
jgi:hypothetical protein